MDLTGVKYVRNSAFWGCGGLTVELPDTIQLIDYNAFGDLQNTSITVPASAIYVGELAFNGPNMTEILVDEDNISYCSKDGVRFTKDGNPNMEINCRLNPELGYYSLATGGDIKPEADFQPWEVKKLEKQPKPQQPGEDVMNLINAPKLEQK